MSSSNLLLDVEGLGRTFGGGKRWFGLAAPSPSVYAVRGVSLQLYAGETLGIVGESGCGKSTLARMLCGLDLPSFGRMNLESQDITLLAKQDRQALARQIQYVFQDPVGALNPRKTIAQILQIPLRYLARLEPQQMQARLEQLLNDVNLREEFLQRYPHEFSGGQAQRIGLARALAAQARILILDEPVSALDVSVQAQVLNLLDDLKQRYELSYVFISHDLSVVESVSDRVAVMYFGRIVETAPAAQLFANPRHPYTRLLLDSAPIPGKAAALNGDQSSELPDPLNPPPGCAFAPRCQYAKPECRQQSPELQSGHGEGHEVACYFPLS